MTNFEYYKEEIKALNYDFAYANGKITKCTCGICGEKCKFYDDNYDDDKDCETNKIEWLYSEHKEQPKLTQNERKLCEILKDGYIVRDKTGSVCVKIKKPFKLVSEGYWDAYGEYFYIIYRIFNDCDFSFIKWEDDEPWAVSDLLKLEVIGDE